jgi:hypothetical protein
MQLNPDQEAAAQAFFNFLFTDQKEFSISGPAGTGKTFLMQHLLDHTLKEYENTCKLLNQPFIKFQPVLTATTNKAAEVLSQTTGRPAITIHKHLGLKVEVDFTSGRTKTSKTSAFAVHSFQLIVVDEASMVNAQLHQFIQAGTNKSCKILYLGDHCQMAPVNEPISPVYRNPKMSVYLNQPMRNASQPALMALCDQLRQTVETGIFQPIREVPGVIDYLPEAQAKAYIDTTYLGAKDDLKLLCFTNKKVDLYNQYIRDLRSLPPIFSPGEKVVNNTSMEYGDRTFHAEEELLVLHVDPTPIPEIIDPADPNSLMEVYKIDVLDRQKRAYSLRCPIDPLRRRQLMNHYASQKDWFRHYHIKDSYPDLRPRDAATVYKAQGSTYREVFLDLADIGTCTHNEQIARMLYVGASRATTRLVLFGNLPQRLFKAAA